MSVVDIVLGTRPEIIKLAPVIRRLEKKTIPYRIIHTGQHYDEKLDAIFFRELALPEPVLNLHAAAATHLQFFASVIVQLEQEWQQRRPKLLIVQGDTNSVLAAALTAERMRIPIHHIEAGLRSDDWSMPEEMNRVCTDRMSERLYAPTDIQRDRLLLENIPKEKIIVCGNTIADALNEHLPLALSTPLPQEYVTKSPYAIMTLHRPALVDTPDVFSRVLDSIASVLKSHGLTGIFLVHPRTRSKITKHSFQNILIHEPLGYLHMLHLLKHASLVLTDSGGLQEESALLQVPCCTIRENTERPETLRSGGNVLVGFDEVALAKAVTQLLSAPIAWRPLYSTSSPADVILHHIEKCASS